MTSKALGSSLPATLNINSRLPELSNQRTSVWNSTPSTFSALQEEATKKNAIEIKYFTLVFFMG